MFIFNSEKLIELRAAKSISRYALSKATKIKQSGLLRLETGKSKNPQFETVEALSVYFKVSMEIFIKEVKH